MRDYPKLQHVTLFKAGRWLGITLIYCLSGMIWGCEPSFPEPLEDLSSPELMVYSPAEGSIYQTSDAIAIDIDVAENDELHFVSLKVLNETADSLIWEYFVHSHERSLSVREELILDSKETKTYLLLIEADDHNGNRSTLLRSFVCQP